MKMQKRVLEIAALGASIAVFSGCASSGVKNPSATGVTELRGDEKGFVAGTGVESQDLVRVSDKIARGILSAPADCQRCHAAGGCARSGAERNPVSD